MTILVVATLFVRMFAILILVYLLGQIPSAYTYTLLDATEYSYFPWFTTIPFVLLFLVFWQFPTTTARILVPNHLHALELNNFNPDALEQASLTIIGLWLVIWSVPDSVNNLFAILMFPTGSPDRLNATGFLITTVVEFGLGLFLILRAQGIHKLIQRLRS